jgi:methionyl aminopeptidase
MGIIIKTPREIAAMRIAGKRHAEILNQVAARVAPGVSTWELDQYAEKLVTDYGDKPAFKNYRPKGMKTSFPGTLCTSVNDEVVHGIPSQNVILQDGDVISIDLGIHHDGVFTDAAITVPVGKVHPDKLAMIDVAWGALQAGIDQVKPGNYTGDIGYAIQQYIGKNYGIVEGFAGHGVGRYIHEDPYIPNYGKPGQGTLLRPGMIIAIEPMITMGQKFWDILSDDWTVVTRDGSVAVHVEHTVLVTEEGCEVLTRNSI